MTFLLVHGAWGGGWTMSKLAHALRQRGAEVFTPTLTGLGEREHLATPDIGLDTHIQDVLAVLHYEDLRDVLLVGHSYGGAVITGVADRAPDRIQRLVYFDAFALRDGQGIKDVIPPETTQALTDLAAAQGDGWRMPCPFTMDVLGVTRPEDIAWIEPGLVRHPLKTFLDPVKLSAGRPALPVSYIYCAERPMGPFDQFIAQAEAEGWDYHELASTHMAPAVAPEQSADLLMKIAGKASLRMAG